ncbi:MAG: response regulator [Burkholderiaceae bacterium]|uniref:response regulator transcription factor n=1 Tax=Ottowia sp. TaxID=1898956 RepID=UPI001D649CAB|nr:DNA-binding response regulator [Ottowia sp.]MCB2026542.1 response regulator [Ottowia sp.]MCP5257551.1 response regulator [Burkholderiaceae bacterium]HPR42772.1 DNA-binding response regulator [Ottowia sp.]HRW72032.1 DNA-binding response regulator [Ottowia sp.]
MNPETPSALPGVVLVVDDAPETLGLLCDALSQEGYTVLVARSAAEAWQRFEMAVPDAVLLDCVMPGEDGFALCRRIKAEPSWAHVPVIFMTGLSETEQIVQGFASGGVDYVVKPLKVPEVLARLATHVHNAQVGRLAREAVDVVGMGIVLVDRQGRVAWRSPQAARWLAEALGPAGSADAVWRDWLSEAVAQGSSARPMPGGGELQAQYLGRAGLGEAMLALRTVAETSTQQRLRDAALTPRETEVLAWLAKGKTNRDIADILGMSPRTVNKHLEHIFEKLGVETRAAAAAIVSSSLPPTPPHA